MACEATWNGLAPFKELDDASFYSIEASSIGALSPASQSALQQTLDALGCISAEVGAWRLHVSLCLAPHSAPSASPGTRPEKPHHDMGKAMCFRL